MACLALNKASGVSPVYLGPTAPRGFRALDYLGPVPIQAATISEINQTGDNRKRSKDLLVVMLVAFFSYKLRWQYALVYTRRLDRWQKHEILRPYHLTIDVFVVISVESCDTFAVA